MKSKGRKLGNIELKVVMLQVIELSNVENVASFLFMVEVLYLEILWSRPSLMCLSYSCVPPAILVAMQFVLPLGYFTQLRIIF